MKRGLVLIILLATLASIFANVLSRRSKTVESKKYSDCIMRLTSCADKLLLQKADTGHYPRQLPNAFPRGCDGEDIGYELSGDGQNWTLYCKGSHHLSLGLKANQPVYTLSGGLQHVVNPNNPY